MQIFNFHDGHVTTFRPNGWSQTLQTSKIAKGTPSDSQLSIGSIGLGAKLFPVGCAQDS